MWVLGKWITDKILSVLGAPGDSGGTSSAGTATAKLNKLLTDWTASRASSLDSISSNTASSTTSSSSGTLSQKLNYVAGLVSSVSSSLSTISSYASSASSYASRGAVKSVQRGTITGNTASTATISISSVTPSKCHVTVYYSNISYGGSNLSSTVLPYIVSLTSTVLTLSISGYNTPSSTNAHKISWEVVEFY